MRYQINFWGLVGICLAVLLFSGMEGCGEDETPAAFLEAVPEEGSTIQPDETITAIFDGEPIGLSVTGGKPSVTGSAVTIVGPFDPGTLTLVLTWPGNAKALTYVVTDGAADDPPGGAEEPVEPPPPPSDPTLILALSFDGNLSDHSQHHNDAVKKGNPKYVAGKFGRALEFNGVNDWVEVPDDPTLSVNNNVTLMAWIYPYRLHGPGGATWQAIVAKGNNPRSYSFYTVKDASLHLSVGALRGSNSGRILSVNVWQHVAVAQKDGMHWYYLNGSTNSLELVAEPLPGRKDTASVRIGNSHEPSRNFWGRMDEVRIWNRALSEAEIKEQMGKSAPPR